MARKEAIAEYISAHDAAQLLSLKHGRPIRPGYISKMLHMKKHKIRAEKRHDILLYHRQDILDCTIGTRVAGNAAS